MRSRRPAEPSDRREPLSGAIDALTLRGIRAARGLAVGSHALLPHTGEVQIRIEASSVSDLFVEAALALAELMAIPAREPPGPWRHVELEARDREALLVAWLDELIARTELDELVYGEVQIVELSDRHLRARFRGTEICEPRTAVKAATFHRLRIDENHGHVLATVTLDV